MPSGGESGWGIREMDADRDRIIESPAKGKLAIGSLRRGHTFLTLQYIRGYENLIYDLADENPRLLDLIDRVETFKMGLVNKLMDAGVEWMGYPENLGMQIGPMLSPDHFRHFIKPSYQRFVSPAREKGCILHMHSDGDIRDLCEDLLDVGMDVLNLQDLVNSLDWIEANLKNKVCIDLDIDRQSVTRFGTPEHIDDHIRTWVGRLGSPQGRLMLIFGLYPGTLLKNAEAVMGAMTKYALHFS
ncbi:MAG TPA: hypothetical protein DIU35_04880 [Candidatus Latescibacteria bacterium]|nr:hypothetical protein [Gemmatimonadota bacterium]HCR16799.1 hypothetical protein [Candidatus Latescibacterota bacterium]|tara:strand:+ start:1304 stop:2032 length:729 start_codon:yes stop_codon:yes gene_type:complete